MVVHRKRKHLKFRGNRAQGYGSHKKHRGGGSRGGRGQAGLHKHKWSYVVKYDPEHFGKHGFKRPQGTVTEVIAVNVRQLDEQAERLLGEKLASKEGDTIKIDVAKIGFDKVLGSGRVTRKLIVEAKYFSEEAKRKIEEAGGQAVVVEKKKINSESEKKLETKAEEKKKEDKEMKVEEHKKEMKEGKIAKKKRIE